MSPIALEILFKLIQTKFSFQYCEQPIFERVWEYWNPEYIKTEHFNFLYKNLLGIKYKPENLKKFKMKSNEQNEQSNSIMTTDEQTEEENDNQTIISTTTTKFNQMKIPKNINIQF